MGPVGHSLVTGTWLLAGERLSAVKRAAPTAALRLEEPLALIVDERLAPRPGDVLLARVDAADIGSGLLPGDELLVSHGDPLPDGTSVTTLGLVVDARWNPVSVAARTVAPAPRTRVRRRLLGGAAARAGRLPAG
jgi:hypothetical protein